MKLGVIIPVHDPRPEELQRAIDSVRAQTFAGWECVIVDDGSSSPLPDVEDTRIRVVRQANHGVSAARNRGAAIVRGDYLAFLDQDDQWEPEKLERQLDFMSRHDLAVCDTDFRIVRSGRMVAYGYEDHRGELCRLLSTAAIGLSTLVVQREAFEHVGGFDPLLSHVQDWALVLALTHAGYRLRRLSDVLGTYHLHDSNATRDYRRTYQEAMAVYNLYWALDGRSEVREAVRRGRAHTRALYAHQAIDAFRDDRRMTHLAWAGRRRPSVVASAVARKVAKDLQATLTR